MKFAALALALVSSLASVAQTPQQQGGFDNQGNFYSPRSVIAGTPALNTQIGSNGVQFPDGSSIPSQVNLDIGSIYNAITNGGAKGDGSTDDTAALTAGCKAATAAGKIFFIPAATYKVSGTVTCNPSPSFGNIIQVMGAYELTRIVSTSSTADIMHLGNGNACATPGLVCGFVKGLSLIGPNSTPSQNGQRALVLDDLTQFRVENIDEGNTDIGFDLINDCYGAIFDNNRGGFFGNNNVSFYMRTGNQSGNQIFLNDDWFGGALAAVYMAGGADGLIINGGQYSLNNAATPSATQAVFMIGIDYLTSATGAIGTISIQGIDTEGAGGWWIHTFGTTAMTVADSDFLDNGTHMSYGVLKAESAGTSRFTFRDINWGQGLNAYFSPYPITIAGSSGNTLFFSSGWRTPSGVTLTFNNGGTSWVTDRSMDPCVITNTILGAGGLHCVSFLAPFNTQRTAIYLDDGLYISTDQAGGLFQSTNAATASPTWQRLVPVMGNTSQKTETAADANVLTVTPASAVGTYQACIEMSLSAASAATIGWTITYTDSNGNAQTPTNLALYQQGTAAPALTFTTSAAGDYSGCQTFTVNNAGTSVVVKTTFSGTSMAAKVSAEVMRLQ